MLEKNDSLRLTVLRFPLMVGVVFIHAFGAGLSVDRHLGLIATDGPVYVFITNLVSQGLARTAIPVFFLFSGYLFFHGWVSIRASYCARILSRTRSLLIPYVFWSGLLLGAILLLQLVPNLASQLSIRTEPLGTSTAEDIIINLLGDPSKGGQPIAYQFWFVRDLMLLTLFSPLVFLLVRFLGWAAPLALACGWFAGLSLQVPATEGILFFTLGAYLQMTCRSLFALDRIGPACALLYLPLLFVDAALLGKMTTPWPFHTTVIAVGIVVVLWVSQWMASHHRIAAPLARLGAGSFFLFAAHEPLLTLLKKAVYLTLHPSSEWGGLAAYFLLPTATVLLCTGAFALLARAAPRFTAMITGGRHKPTSSH